MTDLSPATQAAGLRRIANLLEETYSNFIDKSDIRSVDEARREQIVTRAIAAHAISVFGDEPDPEITANAVCDGNDDGGIDAIYVNNNTKKIIIVQSKYIKDGNGAINSRDFIRFKDACVKVISCELDGFNERFLRNKEVITTAINGFKYKFICVFAYTGVREISDEISRDISMWEKTQNKSLLFRDIDNRDDYSVIFEPFDVAKIAQTLSDDRIGKIDLKDVALDSYGEVTEPFQAIYGAVSGQTINQWWEKYKYALFEKNIRNVLGVSTSVNDGIRKTIQDNPELFWYYNNGITAVYNEVEESGVNLSSQRKYGVFNFKSVSIINGAQTVSTIGEVFNSLTEDKKNLLKVNIRFINAIDSEFLTQVTKFNNTQNRVTGRDFASQRPEQQKIAQEINFIGGYTYKLLRQDDNIATANASKVIDLDDALNALVCKSLEPSLLANLKSNRGRFYESWAGLYERVFIKQIPLTGIDVINSYKLFSDCSDALNLTTRNYEQSGAENSKTLRQICIHGNYVIISLVMLKSKVIREVSHIEEYNKDEFPQIIIDIVKGIDSFIQDNYPSSYIARYFQNREKISQLIEYMKVF
ncbi:AIPR family protein [Pectobacterium sp. CHL-2024]|uniref:AIPR family protein n=1 Tax=Pectobacterium sp. CHL-2024 TaxID=3377079 RepID=UPI00382E4931